MTQAYQEYYSVKDYEQWEGDWELITGMPYAMSPSPSVTHQLICVNLVTQLKGHLDDKHDQCGHCYSLVETDWEVSGNTVVKPDCMVICYEPEEKITRTPSIIFEVVSPSSIKRDELLKFELYQSEGVLFYVLVYPDKQVSKVYKNVDGSFQKVGDFSKEICGFDLIPCQIDLDFSRIWRR